MTDQPHRIDLHPADELDGAYDAPTQLSGHYIRPGPASAAGTRRDRAPGNGVPAEADQAGVTVGDGATVGDSPTRRPE